MAVLTVSARNNLPRGRFGLPGKRKYPMPNRAHAANAKARATQQFNKGNLSAEERAEIVRRANQVLGKSGKTK